MKKLLPIIILLITFSCESESAISPACVELPGGNFDPEKVNVSFGKALLNEANETGILLDSVVFKDHFKISFDENFYSDWIALEEETRIDSVVAYTSNGLYEYFLGSDFPSEAGGYVFLLVKQENYAKLRIIHTGQDEIDNICNDVIATP